MKYLLLIATLLCGLAHASAAPPKRLSDMQKDNLSYAFHFGENYDLAGKPRDIDNPKYFEQRHLGYLMAAIALRESSAGLNTGSKKANHHAYGMFQNHIVTVTSKMKQRNMPVHRAQLRRQLEDRATSAEWAMDELSYWLSVRHGNIRLALASYNAGWNYKAGLKYADEVLILTKYMHQQKFLVS